MYATNISTFDCLYKYKGIKRTLTELINKPYDYVVPSLDEGSCSIMFSFTDELSVVLHMLIESFRRAKTVFFENETKPQNQYLDP